MVAFSIILSYNVGMKRPWLCITAAMALGEVLAYVLGDLKLSWIATAILTPSVVLVVYVLYRFMTDKRRTVLIIGIAFLFGFFRLTATDISFGRKTPLTMIADDNEIHSYDAEVTDITVKPERVVLRCDRLLVYCDSISPDDVKIGNKISITGKFNSMDVPRNPGEFNYRLYYLGNGITHRCFADNVTVTDDGTDHIRQLLYEFRQELLSRISIVYDESDAGVIRAALLGDKSLLDDNIYDLYKENGIAHLLAISGLHTGILGLSLYRFLRRRIKLSYALSGVIAASFICIYCILTGSSVSTVRAVIMLILMFASGVFGRKSDLLNSAGIAAFCILCVRPYQLFSCGFLLSFSAVLAIGGPAAIITEELDVRHPLLQSLVVSLSVQLVTLPVTSYFFFEISLYACLLNLIVIPLMSYVIWSGIGAVVLSFISLSAASVAARSGHFILEFYTLLCRIAGNLPFSTIIIGRPQLWQIIAYYCFFFAVLYFSPSKIREMKSPSSTSDRETAFI